MKVESTNALFVAPNKPSNAQIGRVYSLRASTFGALAALSMLHAHGAISTLAVAESGSVLTTVPQSALLLGGIVDEIRALTMLPNGWDGSDAQPATAEAASAAIQFVRGLGPELKMPRVGYSADGEVGLFWDTDGVFIDVGFTTGSSYSYFARSADGSRAFGDDVPLAEKPDDDLMRFIPRRSC